MALIKAYARFIKAQIPYWLALFVLTIPYLAMVKSQPPYVRSGVPEVDEMLYMDEVVFSSFYTKTYWLLPALLIVINVAPFLDSLLNQKPLKQAIEEYAECLSSC